MTNTTSWREILASDAPTFVDGAIDHFDDAATETAVAETESTKTPLDNCSVVRISGEDASGFVHAQFSGDCLTLGEDQTILTAWCTPKGRVLYLLRLVRQQGSIYALLPGDQAADFCKRLSMFVLRAKVKIEDLSTSYGVIIRNQPITADDLNQQWYVDRFEALADVWSRIAATPVGTTAASLVDVRLGMPRLAKALSDQFLPQELNLDALGGVSFEKGCFPGQEIIARVKFRGAVKRRVQRLCLAGATVPALGTRIVRAHDDNLAGTVLYAAQPRSSTVEMLAVLNVDATDIALEGKPKAPLTQQSLPYHLAS